MVYDLSTGGLMKKEKRNEVREFVEDVEDVEENEFMYQCFLINIKI